MYCTWLHQHDKGEKQKIFNPRVQTLNQASTFLAGTDLPKDGRCRPEPLRKGLGLKGLLGLRVFGLGVEGLGFMDSLWQPCFVGCLPCFVWCLACTGSRNAGMRKMNI